MKKMVFGLLFATCVAAAQTTGVGNTVMQNGAVINPMTIDQILYASQFPGNDIGQKVNNAIAACTPAKNPQCEIHLAAGTFALSTTITVTSPGISIVGAGT